jgi:hypothetical protein
MVCFTQQRTLAERLGLDRFIVDQTPIRERGEWMIRDRSKYRHMDWDCPRCGVVVNLNTLDSAWTHDEMGSPMAGIEGAQRSWLICQCPRTSCRAIVFVIAEPVGSARQIKEVYPYTSASASTFSDSIPSNIREDFAEGSRCFFASAYKATVVMCRRVVQDIAQEKKLEGETIKTTIKNMYDAGLITKPLFDAAHEIRHFGGFGAHPQDDGLDNIGKDDAAEMLTMTNQFLEHIYVLAKQAAAFQDRRQQAAQPGKDTK